MRQRLDAARIPARLLPDANRTAGSRPTRLAAERPMNIIESGPAGGVIGAQALALFRPVSARSSPSTWAARQPRRRWSRTARSCARTNMPSAPGIMVGSRLLTGAGYTLKVPGHRPGEVGAGGGSHVWIDAGGALQVGPQSAGAAPGPGLRRGGEVATVTDRQSDPRSPEPPTSRWAAP